MAFKDVIDALKWLNEKFELKIEQLFLFIILAVIGWFGYKFSKSSTLQFLILSACVIVAISMLLFFLWNRGSRQRC